MKASDMPPNRNPALQKEAEAFDRQILERVANGHLPDLRRATPCDWFRNNTWRHPDLVDLDFGEIFRRIHSSLCEYLSRERNKVLEIGCGPGHISLELSRNGFDVTGVDLSPACIDVARKVSEKDPWKSGRGGLRYMAGDIFQLAPKLGLPFDAVIFCGALHHFSDQDAIFNLCRSLLSFDGILVACEPVRDRITTGNAAVLYLVRTLLSKSGAWYGQLKPPQDEKGISAAVARVLNELRCLRPDGGKIQSDRDNEAGFAEMRAALDKLFQVLVVEPRHAIFHELAGGLRFDGAGNAEMAKFLMHMDRLLIGYGVLEPAEFFFVARKKPPQPC